MAAGGDLDEVGDCQDQTGIVRDEYMCLSMNK
jgi:hypothetical protein